jgi:hypothetical protein
MKKIVGSIIVKQANGFAKKMLSGVWSLESGVWSLESGVWSKISNIKISLCMLEAKAI